MVTELSPFTGIDRDFERLLDGFFTPLVYSQRRGTYPPMNLSEDEHNIYATLEAPGLDAADIEITLTDATLAIKGERKAGEGRFYHRERPHGLFQRVISIGVPVKRDEVKANFKDGVLEVVLPKAEEIKPRKIAIEN